MCIYIYYMYIYNLHTNAWVSLSWNLSLSVSVTILCCADSRTGSDPQRLQLSVWSEAAIWQRNGSSIGACVEAMKLNAASASAKSVQGGINMSYKKAVDLFPPPFSNGRVHNRVHIMMDLLTVYDLPSARMICASRDGEGVGGGTFSWYGT